MLNDEICKLRDRLNESITIGEDFNIIYKLSVELDELIAEYYRKLIKKKKNIKIIKILGLVPRILIELEKLSI